MNIGIENFDSVLDGGFKKGKLNVIGTQPLFGKTALMAMATLNLKENDKNVLFLTQDSSVRVVLRHMYRVISGSSEINKEKVIQYHNGRYEDEIGGITIKQVEYGTTPIELITLIRTYENIDLVILDNIKCSNDNVKATMSEMMHIVNNVEPILLFTAQTNSAGNITTEKNTVALERCDIFTIKGGGYCSDETRNGVLYHNGNEVAPIKMDFNNFTVN